MRAWQEGLGKSSTHVDNASASVVHRSEAVAAFFGDKHVVGDRVVLVADVGGPDDQAFCTFEFSLDEARKVGQLLIDLAGPEKESEKVTIIGTRKS